MENKIRISVCGDPTVIPVIHDSLKTIDGFDVVGSDDLYRSDIIYWIYGKGPGITNHPLLWLKREPLIINHWIGTDVINETKRKQQRGTNRILIFIQDFIFWVKMKRGGLLNLAVTPWIVDELSRIKIKASLLPITTIDSRKLGPTGTQPEKDIDFFSYAPFNRFDFYGGDKIVKLAERWHDYKFLVICIDLDRIPPEFVENMPENISFIPRVAQSEMPRFYQRSKFFLRYTQHDGLSLSVLEALYFNLQILWTYDFPCTQKIDTFERLSESIPALVNSWHPNIVGHRFVLENYSIEAWQRNFLRILQRKMSKKEK